MKDSGREFQVLTVMILGLLAVGWALYVLKTGSYSASRHGNSVTIGGTQAVVVGWFFLILGLLAVVAPGLEAWWRRRRDR